jgi:hypothetical protein
MATETPIIIVMLKKLMAKKVPVFAALGKLRYYLQELHAQQPQFGEEEYLLIFARTKGGNQSLKRITPANASEWTLRKLDDENEYEMLKSVKENEMKLHEIATQPTFLTMLEKLKHLIDEKKLFIKLTHGLCYVTGFNGHDKQSGKNGPVITVRWQMMDDDAAPHGSDTIPWAVVDESWTFRKSGDGFVIQRRG